ncbi:hypothetical protein HK104_008003 [Borealophlyctis nickersoniae]|nr:hypothetical protein HK104_008003 [Borealophlyctis nickersoniae]
MAAFLVNCFFLLLVSLGACAQLFVDPAATSPGDGTSNSPFQSLRQAWDAATALGGSESVITLMPGTHLIPDATYTFSGSVRHIPQIQGTAIISPSTVRSTTTAQSDAFILQANANLTFEGLEFRDFSHEAPVPANRVWKTVNLNPNSTLAFKNTSFTASGSLPGGFPASFTIIGINSLVKLENVTVAGYRFKITVTSTGGLPATVQLKDFVMQNCTAWGPNVTAPSGIVSIDGSASSLQADVVRLSDLRTHFGQLSGGARGNVSFLSMKAITSVYAMQGFLLTGSQLTCTGCSFTDWKNSTYLFWVNSGSTLALTGAKFENSGGMIAYVLDTSSLQMTDSAITGLNGNRQISPFLRLDGSSTGTLRNCMIDNIKNGSAVAVTYQTSNLLLDNTTIRNSQFPVLSSEYGLLRVTGASTTTLKNVSIYGNTFTSVTFWIYPGTQLLVEDSQIGENLLTAYFVYAFGDFNITNTRFYRNTIRDGTWSSSMIFAFSTENDVGEFQLLMAQSKTPPLVIKGTTIRENVGYIQRSRGEAEIQILNSRIENNPGKILLDYASGIIRDTLFINNYGGAVLQVDFTPLPTNTLEISGSSFINNSAPTDGGAVSYTGPHTQISIRNSTFKYNSASRGGPNYASAIAKWLPVADFASPTIYSGQNLPAVRLAALDMFNQVLSAKLDEVAIISVACVSNNTTGERSTCQSAGTLSYAFVDGKTTVDGVSVYGQRGSVDLLITSPMVQYNGINLSLPMTINDCPQGMLWSKSDVSEWPSCIPAVCPEGCSASSGICVDNNECRCSPGFDGVSCELKEGYYDTLSIPLPAGQIPSPSLRINLTAQIASALNVPVSDVVYRAFASNNSFVFSVKMGDFLQGNALQQLANTGRSDGIILQYNAKEKQYIHPSSAGVIIINIVTGALLCCTIAALVTFGVYRATPIIKAASFELSLMTLIGLLLAFTTVYLYIGIPTERLCVAQIFVPMIAFPLSTGPCMAKMIRVAIIWNNQKGKGTRVTTMQLLPIAVGAVLGNLIIAIVWARLAPPTPMLVQGDSSEWWTCAVDEETRPIFLGVSFAFNGLLLIFNCALAYQCRNAGIGFSETRAIGYTVYGILVAGGAALPVLYATGDIQFHYWIRSVCTLFAAAVTLVSLYWSKAYVMSLSASPSKDSKGSNASITVAKTLDAKDEVFSIECQIREDTIFGSWFGRWETRTVEFRTRMFLMVIKGQGLPESGIGFLIGTITYGGYDIRYGEHAFTLKVGNYNLILRAAKETKNAERFEEFHSRVKALLSKGMRHTIAFYPYRV